MKKIKQFTSPAVRRMVWLSALLCAAVTAGCAAGSDRSEAQRVQEGWAGLPSREILKHPGVLSSRAAAATPSCVPIATRGILREDRRQSAPFACCIAILSTFAIYCASFRIQQ